ncbi:PAXIP1-associated glutamate-rich protein 1A [Agrilus planipennis]|uniref:PAXIP1-associated glutamate-rich protein 1A n=1 Tax=Agrilus planipennis TaxID=224129 RepID=A0A1W4XHX3_AGRPL|nr:PAXIP1-associated glutamate-rich protein 1A [Agrilus planipennis]
MMADDFVVECSDDEFKNIKGTWEPPVEEIERLYDILDKGELPEIKWKCPGYRSPSPEVQDQPQEEDVLKPTEDKSDFDFMDEVQSPKLKMRKDGEDALRGSAKKKTTSLDGVLSNMRRHKLLPSQNSNS